MNTLYDVYNSGGRCGWIAARSERRAKDIAMHRGWARNRKNLTVRSNPASFGERFLGWDTLMKGPEGTVCLELADRPSENKWKVDEVRMRQS